MVTEGDRYILEMGTQYLEDTYLTSTPTIGRDSLQNSRINNGVNVNFVLLTYLSYSYKNPVEMLKHS